jgi:hypothetical protein
MTITASSTNRWNYLQAAGATAVIIGTNVVPSPTATQDLQRPYSHVQSVPSSPFAVATDNLIAKISDQLSSRSEAFNAKIARWNRHVVQRLEELRAGAFDFTGLQIPPQHIVDQAWAIASSHFHFNTPPPSVLPSDEGEVLFIWHKSGWDIQINVGPEETTVWAYNSGSSTEFSGSLASRQKELANLLNILGSDLWRSLAESRRRFPTMTGSGDVLLIPGIILHGIMTITDTYLTQPLWHSTQRCQRVGESTWKYMEWDLLMF